MPKYKVVAPIQHDGEVFVPGPDSNPQFVTEKKVGGKENLQAMVAAGAVEVVQDVEALEEPPANYREPDLRLGTGDVNAPGAFIPDIGLATPTNVPQAGPVDRQPIPSVAPQVEVFRKLQEVATKGPESKQPTLADQQEARTKEQTAGAETSVEAQQGGVQDPKKAVAPTKQTPAPVAPNTEGPSPAMATGAAGDTPEARAAAAKAEEDKK